MQIKGVILLAIEFAIVSCQPYAASTTIQRLSQITHRDLSSNFHVSSYGDLIIPRDATEMSENAVVLARDATTTSDSAASTTTTSSSDTTASSTSIASTNTETTSTSTSTSSTLIQSSTTSTAATSSSSTPTNASTTTINTSTATTTNAVSAELAEWNYKGNIAAVTFSCCLVSLFAGISIVHCARDRAKRRRIATSELIKTASSVSAKPPLLSKSASAAYPQSSMPFTDNPAVEQSPLRSAQSMDSAIDTIQDTRSRHQHMPQ